MFSTSYLRVINLSESFKSAQDVQTYISDSFPKLQSGTNHENRVTYKISFKVAQLIFLIEREQNIRWRIRKRFSRVLNDSQIPVN